METAEPPSPPGTSPFPPADFRRRALARTLDLAVPLAPLLFAFRGHSRAWALLAAALVLCGDSLFGAGRSLGKRSFGLRVQAILARRPASVREGMLRNAIFAAPLVPALFGFPLPVCGALLGLALAAEAAVALRPLTRDLGQRRLGDLIARTQVVDGRTALRLPLEAPSRRAPQPAPLASRAARVPSPVKDNACASL